MTRPLPLFGERALHLADQRAIVVGDLHVGLESDLRKAGVHLPSQTERMRARLLALLQSTGATRIIVIGDLKHRIPFSTRQEEIELPVFFRDLPADVDLVPGNHDVDLGGLLDVDIASDSSREDAAAHGRVRIHDAEGIKLGDVGLLHGHTWPSEEVMTARTIVMCHNHPAVMLVDELGHRHKEPCWARAAFTPAAREKYPALPRDAELIVMPAFNELTGGTALNAREGASLLGPLLNHALVDVDGARIYTVDGVELGTIDQLRRFTRDEDKRVRRSSAKQRRRPGWIE